jgi:membrane protease YdiL (CAAX protease family)
LNDGPIGTEPDQDESVPPRSGWWSDSHERTAPRSAFSLQGRPAAGLYTAAWLLGGIGFGLLFFGVGAGANELTLIALPLVVLGLAAAGGYQVIARRGRPPGAYRGPSPLILLGLVFLVVIAATLVAVVAGAGFSQPLTAAEAVLALGIQLFAYLVVGWLAVIRTGALSWREVAMPPTASGGAVAAIASAVGLIALVTLAAVIFGGLLATLLGVEAPDVLPTPRNATEYIAVGLAAVVLAPIGEEFFFRGIALSAWLRDLGPRAALIRTTLLFALIHVVDIASDDFSTGLRQAILVVAIILPVGYALGWLYLRRGLGASIIGHATYNGALLILTGLAERFAHAGLKVGV